MAITTAMRTDVTHLYIALFGRAPDSEGLGYWVDQIGNQGRTFIQVAQDMYNTTPARVYYPLFFTNDEIVTSFYTNTLGRAPDAEGLAYWSAQLNTKTKGQVIVDMLTAVVAYAGADAPALTSQALFNNKTVVAEYYAVTLSGNASGSTAAISTVTATTDVSSDAAIQAAIDAGGGTSGTTFTLTTGTDSGSSFIGTTGNDTFNADLSSTGTNTLNTLDQVNGGTGTDTLNVVLATSATPTSLTSIEHINATAGGSVGASTLGLVNATSVTSVSNNASTQDLTVSGIAAGASLAVTSVASKVTDFQYASTSGTQSVELAVNGVTGGTAAEITIAGVETVTVTSSGTASSYELKTAAATTLNFAGSVAQTVVLDATTLSVSKFDASAATAAVTLTTIDQTAIASAATDVTVLGGSGNDALTLVESNDLSVDGGAGNDTITIAAIDAADSVAGGAGTSDTLVTVAAQANVLDAAAPTTYIITGFENFTVSDLCEGIVVAGNMDTGIAKVTLGNGTAGGTDLVTGGNDTITGGAGSFAVDLGKSFAANSSTLDGALVIADTGSATTDSVTLSNKAVNSTTATSLNVFDAQALTSTGYENVTIATGTASNLVEQEIATLTITPDVVVGTAVSLTVTGDNAFDISTSLTTTSTGLMTVNASGMTAQAAGTTTFDINSTAMGAGGTSSITGSAGDDSIIIGNFASTISGGAGNDAITGGTTADSLSGDAGVDVITGSGGNDTVSGGDGNDTINVSGGAGSVSVDGGAGNDTVVMAATTTSGDTLVGGDGTDVLSITAAIATGTIGAQVSGFETLSTTDATQVMSNFTNNNFTSVIEAASGGDALAVSNANSSLTTFTILDGSVLTSSFARLADGSADSLTVVAGIAIAGGSALTASGEETIVIDSSNFAADLDLATSTSLKTLTLNGDNTTVIDAIAATALATINASGFSGATIALSVDASDSTTAITFTGGTNTGTTTLVTGTGADMVTAGAATAVLNATTGGGNDTVIGNAGADIISTGSGTDSITGGEGLDVITGGGGSDIISLTETTAVSDTVVLDSTGVDAVTGFAAGASGDELELTLASLITNIGVTQFVDLAAAGVVNAGTAPVVQSIANQAGGAAVAAAANATVFLLVGDTFGTTGDVENALETGDYELTVNAGVAVGDAFTVVYSDGTDAYVAIARVAVDGGADIDAGDLTVTNVVKLVGNAAISSAEFVAANFDYA